MKYVKSNYNLNLRFKRIFVNQSTGKINISQNQEYTENDHQNTNGVEEYILVNLNVSEFDEDDHFSNLIWEMKGECFISENTLLELIKYEEYYSYDFDTNYDVNTCTNTELLTRFDEIKQLNDVFDRLIIKTSGSLYQERIKFDLTNFANEHINVNKKGATFLLKMTSLDNQLSLKYTSQSVDDPYLYGFIKATKGLYGGITTDTTNLENYATNVVNLYNGESFINLSLLSSNDIENQINLFFIYNYKKRNTKYIFGNGIRLNYEYEINLKDGSIEVINASGYIDYFYSASSKNNEYISYETSDKLIKDNETIIIEKLNKQRLVFSNIGETYRLSRISYNNKDIYFSYENGRLMEISNGTTTVNFSYKIDYTPMEIRMNNLIRKVTFNYDDNDNLKWIEYRSSVDTTWERETELNTLFINYSTNTISVADSKRNETLLMTYGNNKLISAKAGYNLSYATAKNYNYTNNYTKVSYLENEVYYRFDKIGRLINMMDNNSNIATKSYAIATKNNYSKVSSSFNKRLRRELLKNSSFDENDMSDYKISGLITSIVKVITEENRKYLKIDKKGTEAILITQEIELDPSSETVELNGYYLFSNYNSNLNTNVKISVCAEYEEEVEYTVPGDTSGTTETATKIVTFSETFSECTLTKESNYWSKFTLPKCQINYENRLNFKIIVRIDATGSGYILCLDDLSLVNYPEKSRPNYIKNGYFLRNSISNLNNFTIFGTDINDAVLTNNIDLVPQNINALKIAKINECKNYATTTKIVETKINISGKKDDNLVLSFLLKAYHGSFDIPNINIIFYKSTTNQSYRIESSPYINDYQYIAALLKAPMDYNYLRLQIKHSFPYDIVITAVELTKNDNLLNYKYDDNNNLILIENNNGYIRYCYDDEKRTIKSVDRNKNVKKTLYDNSNRIIKTIATNDLITNITYDEKGNITYQETKDNNSNLVKVTYEYDNANNLTKVIDNLGYETIYEYDNNKNITKTIYPNQLEISNNYNILYLPNMIYTNLNNDNYENILNTIDYVDYDKIAKLTQSTDDVNEFSYDSKGVISSAKNNGSVIQNYISKNNNLISKKAYSSYTSKNAYNFSYDSNNNLTKVDFESSIKAKYEYQNDQLIKIKDKDDNLKAKYEYNENNQVSKITENDTTFIYQSENNQVRQKIIDLPNYKQVYNYETSQYSNEYTLEGIFERIAKSYNADIIDNIDNKVSEKGLSLIVNNVYSTTSSNINYMAMKFDKCNSKLSFKILEDQSDNNGLFQKNIILWIKTSGQISTNEIIATICCYNDQTSLINMKLRQDGTIYFEDFNGTIYNLNIKLNIDTWNMLTIYIIQPQDNLPIIYLKVKVNKEKFENTLAIDLMPTENSDDVLKNLYFKIGNDTTNQNNLTMPYEIYKILIPEKDIAEKMLENIYEKTIKHLNNNNPYYSYNTTIYQKYDLINNGDLVTFNGITESINGKQPINISLMDNSYTTPIAKKYKYDEDEKRHIYGVYSTLHETDIITLNQSAYASYNLDLSSVFTIGFKIKYEQMKKLQDVYLFTFIKDDIIKLGILLLATDQIKFIVNGEIVDKGGNIMPNMWHTIFIENNSSGVLSAVVDGRYTEILNVSNLDLTDSTCYIGCAVQNSTVSGILNGKIENLYYSSQESEIQTSKVKETLTPIIYQKTYDIWNRLVKTELKINDNSYTETYNYLVNNNQITTLIKEEVANNVKTSYLYDNMNCVCEVKRTNITTTEFIDKIKYYYTPLGQLEKECKYFNENSIKEETYYTYDKYGNIKTKKHSEYNEDSSTETEYTYNYNATYKTRLDSIANNNNNITFEYSSYNSLYPSKITINDDAYNLTYEGTMIKTINDNITYYYDEQNRRIKKIVDGIDTNFIYEGDKLIQINIPIKSIQITYIYDEISNVIGFIYNNIEYFFEKNNLGNIIRIFDKNNNTIAIYDYDGYGKHKVLDSLGVENNEQNFIGNINPFRYKGYYYDVETNLFLVTSRYYSPELGRFIQPADVPSLNPSSINGLNLYSYANNNPIGIAYSSSSVNGSASGGMVNSLSLGGSIGGGIIGGDSSSWFATLPAVPNALKHISKANDVFSAVSHSFMVGKYLFGNGRLHTLSYLDDMRMLGVNPAKGLSSLPKASWLNKIGYVFAAIDGAVTFYDNLQQGNSWGQALLDGALSFGKSAASAWVGGFVGANVGGMIGAALGSIIPIPGVGTFIGFVVGTGVGIVVSWFVDDVLGLLKDGLLDLIFD